MTIQPDLNGKLILITGATAGIGLSAARALAGMGASILGVGRSEERCIHAEAEVRQQNPSVDVHFFTADLASQAQVRRLAKEITDFVSANHAGKLDVLANNAGVVSSWYTSTEDGYEMQFAVNHLAPFLLTNLLLPVLKASPQARILTTSSRSHRTMRIFWNDIMLRRFYNPLLAYKQTKLANVLFTVGLEQRLNGTTNIRAYAIDPGLVNTQIGAKNNSGIVQWVWNLRRQKGADPMDGAKTLVYVASEPELNPPDGIYWRNCRAIPPSRYSQRLDESQRLWELSERLCGLDGRLSG